MTRLKDIRDGRIDDIHKVDRIYLEEDSKSEQK